MVDARIRKALAARGYALPATPAPAGLSSVGAGLTASSDVAGRLR